MTDQNYIKFFVDYNHNIHSCKEHEGEWFSEMMERLVVWETKGFYKEHEKEIVDFLDVESKAQIIQILSLKSLNLMQLKKIMEHSYGTLHGHIQRMKKLRLVKIEKNNNEQGKAEKRISLNEDVKIIPIHQDNARKEIIEVLDEQSSNSKKEFEKFKIWLDKKIIDISKEPTIRESTR